MNNFDDDSNPFAAASPRPATTSSVSNQPTNDNNPFAATATPVQPTSPKIQPTTPAAYLPTEQPSTYTDMSTPARGSFQQPATTRIDLGDVERRQTELDERERRLAERERAVGSNTIVDSPNNFPPFPAFCPCKPCFHQDIRADIPPQFQRWLRMVFYLWLIYIIALFFNGLSSLGYMVLGNKSGLIQFCLSVAYFLVFIPLSYIFWFRSLYRAFRNDSSVFFMTFFLIDFFFVGTNILFALGVISGQCGFFTISSVNTDQKGLKIMIAISGGIWTLVASLAVLLTIKIHRLYRQSGASIERAQKEFQTTIVNSPTVRNAARDVAKAGINEALSTNENERIIY